MNTVRFPVVPALWKRDGQAYFDRVAAVVRAANGEGLVAVLAAYEDGTGLPSPDLPAFWTACATAFRTPAASSSPIPRAVHAQYSGRRPRSAMAGVAQRRRVDRRQDRDGNASAGRCDPLHRRRAGDRRPGVSGCPRFQDFGPDAYLRDPNVIYEVHPFFDQQSTDDARDAAFGF